MRIVYFYAKEGKKIGPLSREQLDDLHLAPDTLVWHYGLTGWIPYKNLPQQAVKENEESPFDNFRVWLKGKKKTAAKAETNDQSVVESPSAKVEEAAVEPVVDGQEMISQPVTHKAEEVNKHSQKKRSIFKKTLIGLSILIGVAALIFGGICLYGYITYEYLPERRLNAACADLESKWGEADEVEKIALAIKILTKNPEWGYENVDDDRIQEVFSYPKAHEALKVLEREAYQGNTFIQNELGRIYYHGYSKFYVSEDDDKAAYWFKEAADNGNMRAMGNLGICYEYGIGVKKNMNKAVECYRKSANGNDAYGLYHLGRMYENGVKSQVGSHWETYEVSSDKQYIEGKPKHPNDILVRKGYYDWSEGGRYQLFGKSYYKVYKHKVINYKVIVPQDINKARECWQKSAALGNEAAKEKLQKIYE